MNTEFLNDLGITDKEVINKIFAEHGKELNAVKNENTELNTKVNNLTTELENRDTQLDDLKSNLKDNEKLTNKITELETENQQNKEKYKAEIIGMKKTNLVSQQLKDKYNVKNITAISPFLHMEKINYDEENNAITGLEDQIKPLQENEDTSFLFNVKEPPKPAGTQIHDPNPFSGKPTPNDTKDLFAQAVAEKLAQ